MKASIFISALVAGSAHLVAAKPRADRRQTDPLAVDTSCTTNTDCGMVPIGKRPNCGWAKEECGNINSDQNKALFNIPVNSFAEDAEDDDIVSVCRMPTYSLDPKLSYY
ncbi:hypothetical protein M011DRAFT_461788 [Sporormia fimetaria CBS 119925]|uniref:Uncharacterized protein n=1 Tax=Sporormia fimetaria CBS 119925 TaxID=1340428 RepID=A0A6A6V0V4_9PLEO|nr:hypothetical protein M011DRAFT_461788 [Sporormia fimetaria CBS 119925]